MSEAQWLPIVFMCLVGLATLAYAILDGYDLGVGILLPIDDSTQSKRDTMIASIGPFWDANETWLVLAIGLLLIAFPEAHSIILKELYIPATFMLISLILRGVAFDFRAKALTMHRKHWDICFKFSSLVTALSQGYMLGRYVLGFSDAWAAIVFAIVSAFCVAAAYAFIGGAWLVMKTQGSLQIKSAYWARRSAWLAASGILLVSIINPFVSEHIYMKWFSFPQIFILFPIPLVCLSLFILSDRYLRSVPHAEDFGCWIPFVCAAIIFFLCFQALGYSFYPYVIPGQLTVAEASSAPESLMFIFYGAAVVVPCILGYTIFSYRVFWGKARSLSYY
ncbi:cytochrome d ubiquinol oxidase subunit II [Agarilytica rhodophyticola]|uniref:cytochrome d ubiquinol oxidase subunit II n=1 Tax=Agarilytica rhodophyticola TaxID=1737490 RepID=UPI000B345CE8|nr:cytochrome d ubiquinol oxidase subunit II [Agarilytica rhodophyticola]